MYFLHTWKWSWKEEPEEAVGGASDSDRATRDT
jgi:hypothetical protein